MVVVGGCRLHCGSGRSGGKPTQWMLWMRIDLAVLVALASLHGLGWSWLFCSRLCGQRRR